MSVIPPRELTRKPKGLVSSAPPGPFDPTSLFASGEQGGWYDPSDLASLFSDTAGTVPAVVDGPVALMRDKSGRGWHASNGTAGTQPILRNSGALYWLESDGVDDFLAAGTMTVAGSDQIFVCAGVRKLSDAAIASIIETGSGSTIGTFGMLAPGLSAANTFAFRSRGTVLATSTATGQVAPITAVVTGIAAILTDFNITRVNGVQLGTIATDQGTGNYVNTAVNFFRRAGGTQFFGGRFFGAIIRSGTLSGQQITDVEAWITGKTGPLGA